MYFGGVAFKYQRAVEGKCEVRFSSRATAPAAQAWRIERSKGVMNMCKLRILFGGLIGALAVVGPAISGVSASSAPCEPCPAIIACEVHPDCVPSVCECTGAGWRCTADCGGECPPNWPPLCPLGCCDECGARIVNLDLRWPNRVEVCVSNVSDCTETSNIIIELDGPTCRWNTQLQLTLAPGETRCVDAQAPSQCYFDFGRWCVQAEVWNESRLCDVRQECRDFCTQPSPAWNARASDGEYCEGVRVTWRHEGFFPPRYEVYRSEKPERCVAPVLASVFGESYFDVQAAPDTTYHYSVRAITPCGPSACSNTDDGHRASVFADWDHDCDVRLDDYAVFSS